MDKTTAVLVTSSLKWTLGLRFQILSIEMAKGISSMLGQPEKRRDLEKYFKKVFKIEVDEFMNEFENSVKKNVGDVNWMRGVMTEDLGKMVDKMKMDRIDRDEVPGEDSGE